MQASLAQEWDQLVDAEVRQHLAMPIHRWGFRLTGKRNHFPHCRRVSGDNDDLHLKTLAVQERYDIVAPRTAGFDIKDRQTHAVSITSFVLVPSACLVFMIFMG